MFTFKTILRQIRSISFFGLFCHSNASHRWGLWSLPIITKVFHSFPLIWLKQNVSYSGSVGPTIRESSGHRICARVNYCFLRCFQQLSPTPLIICIVFSQHIKCLWPAENAQFNSIWETFTTAAPMLWTSPNLIVYDSSLVLQNGLLISFWICCSVFLFGRLYCEYFTSWCVFVIVAFSLFDRINPLFCRTL